MKKLIINGIVTELLVKNAEDAVYGRDTARLFEYGTITDVNDAFEDKVFVNIDVPNEYRDLFLSIIKEGN